MTSLSSHSRPHCPLCLQVRGRAPALCQAPQSVICRAGSHFRPGPRGSAQASFWHPGRHPALPILPTDIGADHTKGLVPKVHSQRCILKPLRDKSTPGSPGCQGVWMGRYPTGGESAHTWTFHGTCSEGQCLTAANHQCPSCWQCLVTASSGQDL